MTFVSMRPEDLVPNTAGLRRTPGRLDPTGDFRLGEHQWRARLFRPRLPGSLVPMGRDPFASLEVLQRC